MSFASSSAALRSALSLRPSILPRTSFRTSRSAGLAEGTLHRPAHICGPQRRLQPTKIHAEAAEGVDAKDDLGVPVSSPYSEEQQEAAVQNFRKHQEEAPRISNAEEARTLLAAAGTGVLSTMSVAKISQGYPSGSVINMAVDEAGRPIISISTLSLHTSDLQASSKCSVTVTAGSFADLSDARVTLTGDMTPVPDAEVAAVRDLFLAKHPDCFYVDFGDFAFYRMDNIVAANFIGGFGRVAQIQAGSYLDASPDPISPFSSPVAGHMNADHGSASIAMVKKYTGLPVEDAKILSLDRLGMNMMGTFNGMSMKIRLPFPRPAEDRKSVKTLIVEMTKESAEFMTEA